MNIAGSDDIMDGIEPCRTCGIFYLTASNFLRKIFESTSEEHELTQIRKELLAWNIDMKQDDGLPQYICTCCILEFQKLIKFKQLCVELQAQWRHFYNVREENKLFIKKELPDVDEKSENVCDFIYVDDISDSEYNGDNSHFTPFAIPHVPIKEEPSDNSAAALTDSFLPTADNKIFQHKYNVDNVVSTIEETQQRNGITHLDDSVSNALDTIPTLAPPSPPANDQLLDGNMQEDSSFESNQKVQGAKEIECNLCLHVSSDEDLHRQHMLRIHEIKDMECHICGKKFKNSTSTRLKYHLKWHRISKHIKCAQCGFFCDSRELLKEHTKAMHSKIECTTCGKRILGKKMKNHMRTHEIRTWPCSYCNDVFDTENILEAHIWDIHAQEETPTIPLPEMNESNEHILSQMELDTNAVENHLLQQNVTGDEEAQLQTAADQFSYQDSTDTVFMNTPVTNLQNTTTESIKGEVENVNSPNITSSDGGVVAVTQVISSDEEVGEKECTSTSASNDIICPQCPKTFTSKTDVSLHYQEHLDKPGFGCYVCGKIFKIKFSLNRHFKKHLSE